ncbi:MAG: polysulfide reductase NrfD [Planctomycetaceae bacterium]|jgi:Ni/Fe-hydrogenase subunit HybB-like protein|nr:polysulfide reductase NrfD [Planctomycetaceae bacterium]MBT6153157.1 polysulfide reductase NrfD [Planctomycetaceae bacterium]MBT6485859.1 polysulfide reductase NrfD [Planctomycetaceae bacterium]
MDANSFVFPNDPGIAWSIMIVLYPYITGLVAGAFVVSALYHVFHQEVLKPVAKLALVTSLCFCSCATLPLLLHLHHPERALNIMVTPNGTSAMAGFGFIYSLYMLLLVVEVWLVFRPTIVERANSRIGAAGLVYRILALGARKMTDGSRQVDDWAIRLLAMAGIPIACILHGYVGFLFGAIKANPWWSTALMPVIFLISAIVSGIAGLIVLYVGMCWRRGVKPDADCVRAMCRYLWVALVVAVSLEMLELGHMAYESGAEWKVLSTLLTEHLAVSYGLIQVVIGSLCPFLLLLIAVRPRLNPRLMTACGGLASLLVLVQVFAMRWNVVVGGQLFSKSYRGFVEYTVPWGGREGIIAAAIVLTLPLLALWLADKLLPLWQDSEPSASLPFETGSRIMSPEPIGAAFAITAETPPAERTQPVQAQLTSPAK